MKRYVRSAKELSRGVFWDIEGELLAFPFSDEYPDGVSKSGLTYNHEKLWPDIKPHKCNKPFNYYPRGRVEISNSGKVIIYMNPNIPESMIPEIKIEFGILDDPDIRYDYSEHYKCYLDR